MIKLVRGSLTTVFMFNSPHPPNFLFFQRILGPISSFPLIIHNSYFAALSLPSLLFLQQNSICANVIWFSGWQSWRNFKECEGFLWVIGWQAPFTHTGLPEIGVPWPLPSCATSGSNFRSCWFPVCHGSCCLLLDLPVTLSRPSLPGLGSFEILFTHSFHVVQGAVNHGMWKRGFLTQLQWAGETQVLHSQVTPISISSGTNQWRETVPFALGCSAGWMYLPCGDILWEWGDAKTSSVRAGTEARGLAPLPQPLPEAGLGSATPASQVYHLLPLCVLVTLGWVSVVCN